MAMKWQEEFRAKAYRGLSSFEWKNEDSLSTSGDSIEDALTKIKTCVDERNNTEGITHATMHLSYLRQAHLPFRGHSTESRIRSEPHWKCFKCDSHFDEFMGLLCSACNTEVCPNCGACHCDYRGTYR